MSTDDARGVAIALHDLECSDRCEPQTMGKFHVRAERLLASPQFARLIEHREAAARAEALREVREAVEGVIVSEGKQHIGGHRWIRDDYLRAVLAGQGGESGEGASLRMQYEASQEALSRCLAENRENRQAADYRLILLHSVLSCVDTHPEYDLPLTLLEAIRHETSSGDADSGGQA